MDNNSSPQQTVLARESPQVVSELPTLGGIIAALQAKGDYYGLIQAAERADLVAHDDHLTRLLIAVPLVLSYLIVNDLPSAKFALLRIPDAVASVPLAQATLKLFASVWERRYENIFSRGEALSNLARRADHLQEDLAELIAGLVGTFIESFRQRTFVLVSKAYTTIPLSLAQVYLGLQSDHLLRVTSSEGWHFDAPSQILTPVRIARGTEPSPASSTLLMFEGVTDNVARLET
ncbi:COP9 signalosome [Lactarius akahatsu]|uniref:COP9 signalosome n=1 Tax=Lactarius akahatsu TaxID=416441 RepID=A0AAD4LS42_9AGAM|nr:COP9 signalosome [Lactarius akahatsu]